MSYRGMGLCTRVQQPATAASAAASAAAAAAADVSGPGF